MDIPLAVCVVHTDTLTTENCPLFFFFQVAEQRAARFGDRWRHAVEAGRRVQGERTEEGHHPRQLEAVEELAATQVQLASATAHLEHFQREAAMLRTKAAAAEARAHEFEMRGELSREDHGERCWRAGTAGTPHTDSASVGQLRNQVEEDAHAARVEVSQLQEEVQAERLAAATAEQAAVEAREELRRLRGSSSHSAVGVAAVESGHAERTEGRCTQQEDAERIEKLECRLREQADGFEAQAQVGQTEPFVSHLGVWLSSTHFGQASRKTSG